MSSLIATALNGCGQVIAGLFSDVGPALIDASEKGLWDVTEKNVLSKAYAREVKDSLKDILKQSYGKRAGPDLVANLVKGTCGQVGATIQYVDAPSSGAGQQNLVQNNMDNILVGWTAVVQQVQQMQAMLAQVQEGVSAQTVNALWAHVKSVQVMLMAAMQARRNTFKPVSKTLGDQLIAATSSGTSGYAFVEAVYQLITGQQAVAGIDVFTLIAQVYDVQFNDDNKNNTTVEPNTWFDWYTLNQMYTSLVNGQVLAVAQCMAVQQLMAIKEAGYPSDPDVAQFDDAFFYAFTTLLQEQHNWVSDYRLGCPANVSVGGFVSRCINRPAHGSLLFHGATDHRFDPIEVRLQIKPGALWICLNADGKLSFGDAEQDHGCDVTFLRQTVLSTANNTDKVTARDQYDTYRQHWYNRGGIWNRGNKDGQRFCVRINTKTLSKYWKMDNDKLALADWTDTTGPDAYCWLVKTFKTSSAGADQSLTRTYLTHHRTDADGTSKYSILYFEKPNDSNDVKAQVYADGKEPDPSDAKISSWLTVHGRQCLDSNNALIDYKGKPLSLGITKDADKKQGWLMVQSDGSSGYGYQSTTNVLHEAKWSTDATQLVQLKDAIDRAIPLAVVSGVAKILIDPKQPTAPNAVSWAQTVTASSQAIALSAYRTAQKGAPLLHYGIGQDRKLYFSDAAGDKNKVLADTFIDSKKYNVSSLVLVPMPVRWSTDTGYKISTGNACRPLFVVRGANSPNTLYTALAPDMGISVDADGTKFTCKPPVPAGPLSFQRLCGSSLPINSFSACIWGSQAWVLVGRQVSTTDTHTRYIWYNSADGQYFQKYNVDFSSGDSTSAEAVTLPAVQDSVHPVALCVRGNKVCYAGVAFETARPSLKLKSPSATKTTTQDTSK